MTSRRAVAVLLEKIGFDSNAPRRVGASARTSEWRIACAVDWIGIEGRKDERAGCWSGSEE